ncbi:MAG: recombinase family protein, partial [candidate division Zixibacteria bacterium]|nr:recombinase family protein [candidate division Zixibacteria bacterium]
MAKAVTYARVSTKDQEREGYSIPAQLELLRTYAHRRKIEVVCEFLESDSAGKAGRKQFGEMVALLQEDRSITAILVEKTDRLYRNYKDRVLIDDLEVEIHFVKDGRIIGKDSRPSDKFAHDIETAQARFYLNNL